MEAIESPLISARALKALMNNPQHRLFDCRFSLAAPNAGREDYLNGHIPGAVYLHLDSDLSSRDGQDQGRHPLPRVEELESRFSRWGIDEHTIVTAYDDAGGMVAARLWWMLRYLGFDAVRVLDGGWQAWLEIGGASELGEVPLPEPKQFPVAVRSERLVHLAALEHEDLLDAREPARFQGKEEPIDPVAGHIPGARNFCWRQNLDESGRFLPPTEIRQNLTRAFLREPDANTTHYCGSGVSACHNILAQAIAGLPEPRLYSGSWSEWCRDRERRVMIGEDP